MTGHFAEEQFEAFLVENEVEFRRIPVAADPTPDFELVLCGQKIAVEVKQIDMNAEDRRVLREVRAKRTASYYVPNRVRGKLKHVSGQLRAAASASIPTVLVLYNNVPLYDHLCAQEVLDAMFGQKTYTVGWPLDQSARPTVTRVHAGGSRAVTPSENTSLSAVGTLEREGRDRLRVYHNPFARVPLPIHPLAGIGVRQFTVHVDPETQLPSWRQVDAQDMNGRGDR